MVKKKEKVVESASFEFSKENLKNAKEYISKYPQGKQRSALLPLLHLAQKQNDNWIPQDALDYVADMLELPETAANSEKKMGNYSSASIAANPMLPAVILGRNFRLSVDKKKCLNNN